MSHAHKKAKSSEKKKAAIFITNGSEEIESVVPIDVLRRAHIDVTVVGVDVGDDLIVEMSRKTKLVADVALADLGDAPTFDLLLLPGGMPGAATLGGSAALRALLARQLKTRGALTGAICAAPAVALGRAGLLDPFARATCFPAFAGELGERFEERRVVVAADAESGATLVTSQGPGTAEEFSLKLVELLVGKEEAAKVAGGLLARPLGDNE